MFAAGIELLQKQMEQEDLSCLPSLKVDDIDPLVKPEITETTTLCKSLTGTWQSFLFI